MIEQIIGIFIALLTISFCIERTVEYVFSIQFLKIIKDKCKIIPLKIFTVIGVSIAAAYFSNIDIIKLLLNTSNSSLFGIILTGLFISGGSNVINDVIAKIKQIKTGV